LHGKKQFIQGTGDFVGANRSTGTEREQRDDAKRVDDKIIRQVDIARKLRGRDEGETWDDVRYRW
jgi:hypothetical protein